MRTADRAGRADRFLSAVTLRQIRYFVAVAESGKISAAAHMVGISPSVVTEAIAELESLFEARLFLRQPRGLDLTYDGHRFLAHCRNILSAVEGAHHALSRPDSEMEGTLTLATTITVAGYFLAPLLARFRNTFPNIRVQVVEAKRDEIERGLVEGPFDLGLILVSNLSDRKNLLTHTLVHSMRRLWLPPKHPLLLQEVITLADVARLPYIQLLIDDAEVSTSAYWTAHSLRPDIVFRTESVEAVRSFISYRNGVTILSDMMYRPWSLEGERIEVREVAANIPTLNTGLAWPRHREPPPSARAFIEFCRIEYDSGRLEVRRNMPVERE
jgi:DNA-binding transcriptional LysR family regulator